MLTTCLDYFNQLAQVINIIKDDEMCAFLEVWGKFIVLFCEN